MLKRIFFEIFSLGFVWLNESLAVESIEEAQKIISQAK